MGQVSGHMEQAEDHSSSSPSDTPIKIDCWTPSEPITMCMCVCSGPS